MNEENVMNILHANREKLEKHKNIIRLAIVIVVTIVCVCGIYYLYMNRHVKFQDKNMAYEISRTIGPNVNPENVKYKDVYAIKELNIGQLGKYDTLEDIYKSIDGLDDKGLKMLATEWKNELGIRNPMKKLVSEKENAFMSKKLATIKTDIDLDITLDDLKLNIDKSILREQLDKYEMKSIKDF